MVKFFTALLFWGQASRYLESCFFIAKYQEDLNH